MHANRWLFQLFWLFFSPAKYLSEFCNSEIHQNENKTQNSQSNYIRDGQNAIELIWLNGFILCASGCLIVELIHNLNSIFSHCDLFPLKKITTQNNLPWVLSKWNNFRRLHTIWWFNKRSADSLSNGWWRKKHAKHEANLEFTTIFNWVSLFQRKWILRGYVISETAKTRVSLKRITKTPYFRCLPSNAQVSVYVCIVNFILSTKSV